MATGNIQAQGAVAGDGINRNRVGGIIRIARITYRDGSIGGGAAGQVQGESSAGSVGDV